jgi:hypothetical protein
MPGGADYPMATTEHHLGKTIKDIYIFILGLNAALHYLQEMAKGLELHPLFSRLLQDTDHFLNQHDQLKISLTCAEHSLNALSGQAMEQNTWI